jgi:hypothetical protein
VGTIWRGSKHHIREKEGERKIEKKKKKKKRWGITDVMLCPIMSQTQFEAVHRELCDSR